MIAGKTVHVEEVAIDRYKRTVGKVFYNGENINHKLVEDGRIIYGRPKGGNPMMRRATYIAPVLFKAGVITYESGKRGRGGCQQTISLNLEESE